MAISGFLAEKNLLIASGVSNGMKLCSTLSPKVAVTLDEGMRLVAETAAGPGARATFHPRGVLAVLAHVLLLIAVLGQIVFLASRNRVRWDLTSDSMWSVTDSTRNLIDKLDKQLLIEAYFSPKDKLPVTHREVREVLDNFLDELVQLDDSLRQRGIELVIAEDQQEACLEAISSAARTGKIGDGKIFVSEVEKVIRIRTGEEDEAAI